MDNKEYYKGIVTGVLAVIFIGVSGLLGYSMGDSAGNDILDSDSKQKINFIEELVETQYLDTAEIENMEEGLYAGMLAGLGDPYSRYYTAEQYEELTKESDGAYVGIGVVIQENSDGSVEIIECYKGAPGEMAGLLPGDVLVDIDGTDVTASGVSEILDLIKNAEGDSISLKVKREGMMEPISFTVQIRNVELQYVFGEMYNEEIGYMQITEFSGVTHKQYTEVFEELRAHGMEKLIVDIRSNPGGLYTSVCDILDDILPEELIVYTENKYGEREETYSDAEAPMAVEMAVLVDGNSASAAEIFAGVIQDYDMGTIVGTTTYGKGVVQSIYQLEDGSAVKLTVEQYYTPSGKCIHGVGIEPDVTVEPEDTENGEHKWDNQVEAAAEILTSLQ